MSLIKEISEAQRFFSKTPYSDKEIVFYAEHKGDWPFFEGIINELTGRGQTISYITSDLEDPVLAQSNPNIKTFFLRTILPFVFVYINSKVIVMTVPDLDHLKLRRGVNKVQYIYVMHTLVSTFRTYNANALDAYDTIFCAGPHHVEEVRRREELAKLSPKRLIEQGYYRLEEVYRNFMEYKKSHRPNAKPVALIAPSWGKDNLLAQIGLQATKKLLECGYEVIVRPHPETVRKQPAILSRMQKEFGADSNFSLETSISSIDALLKADILVSDMSGVAVEYALGTERPVLFIDVPLKVINLNFKEMGIEPVELKLRPQLGTSITPEEVNNIDRCIKDLLGMSGMYKEKLASLRNKYIFNFGNSSNIGTDYLLSQLKK